MKMQIRMTLLFELNSAHLVTKKHELGGPAFTKPSLRHHRLLELSIRGLIMEYDVCYSKPAAENAKMLSLPLL